MTVTSSTERSGEAESTQRAKEAVVVNNVRVRISEFYKFLKVNKMFLQRLMLNWRSTDPKRTPV